MRLLQRFLWQLAARGLHDRIAFVTDGRISGTRAAQSPRSRPKQRRVARSQPSATVTLSRSTLRPAGSTSTSPTKRWPAGSQSGRPRPELFATAT